MMIKEYAMRQANLTQEDLDKGMPHNLKCPCKTCAPFIIYWNIVETVKAWETAKQKEATLGYSIVKDRDHPRAVDACSDPCCGR